jgi:hypothetical protein
MIQMKWRADSENSENSALDTIIVSHKIYEKKLFLHRFHLISSDSPIKQPTGIPIYQYTISIPGYTCTVYRYTSIFTEMKVRDCTFKIHSNVYKVCHTQYLRFKTLSFLQSLLFFLVTF